MANTDAPRGFRQLRHNLDKCHRYYKGTDAGIIGVGDPVIRQADSADPEGYAEIVRATTGAAITGIVVAIEPQRSDLSKRHLASADTGYVLVDDDPDSLFVVQDNGGATGITVEDIGEHVDSVAAIDADTTTGVSKYEIDTEAQAADNTFRIERLLQREDNEASANADWVVSVNLHTEANGSATRKTAV